MIIYALGVSVRKSRGMTCMSGHQSVSAFKVNVHATHSASRLLHCFGGTEKTCHPGLCTMPLQQHQAPPPVWLKPETDSVAPVVCMLPTAGELLAIEGAPAAVCHNVQVPVATQYWMRQLCTALRHASVNCCTILYPAGPHQGCIVFATNTCQVTAASLQAPTHPKFGLRRGPAA